MNIKVQEFMAVLEGVRKRLYADQPMTMDAVEKLIDLLAMAFCPHDFENRRVGGDPTDAGSGETVTVCKKCGYELNLQPNEGYLGG